MSRSYKNRHLQGHGGFVSDRRGSNKYFTHLHNRRFRRTNKWKLKCDKDLTYKLDEVTGDIEFLLGFQYYINYDPTHPPLYAIINDKKDYLKFNRK